MGFSVKDVREHGLRGHPDEDIYAFAQEENAVIISGDLGFGDVVRYPLGSHHLDTFGHEILTDVVDPRDIYITEAEVTVDV